ncbi:hypothetical protein SPRG_19585 [Saprolegnia parasitica CBS 223.65]|uniref:Uncharacterized protein n=1 Tax=Saprolegnia parasitica (strain CBS 223.65) TaxID=695850 RepID=A0A067CW81_SAPPC|nr:hypothetical protein SPRG_19585 [Saprolegnia parasitica CBS 223.65]KDO31057.1 hypothetical protein SPRG_19585 [Saprolegnia parasitica CBS 223.65]|eukprot:XP_012198318.1 hypothetical protein SPRG_19585 [Saprolegnia parasitica CBS 223.65]
MEAQGFERALAAIRRPAKPFATGRESHAHPHLHVHGMDAPLQLPIDEAQAARLSRGCPLLLVPAQRLESIDAMAYSMHLAREIEAELAPRGPFHATLSHLVMDRAGASASSLRPQVALPGTFGVLIVLLPSHYDGGRILLSHNGLEEACEYLEEPTPMADLVYAAAYLDATIVSEPIHAGIRTALVFALRYASPDIDCSTAPDDAIAALAQLAAQPCGRDVLWGVDVEHPLLALDRGQLRGTDAAVVNALLVTGQYDVALVQYARAPSIGAFFNLGDDDDDDDVGFTGVVATAVVVEASCPSFVSTALVGATVGTMLESGTRHWSWPSTSVVFWAKKHRVRLLGTSVALSTLTSASQRTAHALGCASPNALAAEIITFFGASSSSDVIDHGQHLPKKRKRKSPVFGDIVGRVLDDLKDITLVALYVGEHAWVSSHASLTHVASWTHHFLVKYGWEQLGASTLLRLVPRWSTSSWAHAAYAAQLLCSLVGVATMPVCPVLTQPFVDELVFAGYTQLLTAVSALPDMAPLTADATGHFVREVLALEAYLLQDAGSKHQSKWLMSYLPRSLLLEVDAFLGPTHSMLGLVQRKPKTLCPLSALAPAVASAVVWPTAAAMHVLATLPTATQAMGTSVDVLFSVLHVVVATARGAHLEALLNGMWRTWSIRLVPAIAALLRRHVSVPTLAASHFGTMLLQSVSQLLGSNNSAFLQEHYAPTATALGLVRDAADVVHRWTPMSAFFCFASQLTSTLSATPDRGLEIYRSVVFRLLDVSFDVWPASVVEHLARACVARLEAEAVVELPTLDDLTIRGLVPSSARHHCHSCATFLQFLESPTGLECDFDSATRRLCPNVWDVVVANADRLECVEWMMEGSTATGVPIVRVLSVLKTPQEQHAPTNEWKRRLQLHQERSLDQWRVACLHEAVHRLTRALSVDTESETTRRFRLPRSPYIERRLFNDVF